ncbi:MAG: glycosyltransferase [Planctomycetes bacterium]|nr:glycosyltransferase [Planctomycetota bacterium]
MQVSAIIPCHNSVELTRACIRSLVVQTAVTELEILVVDNASTDDTRNLAALHPAVRVISLPENRGFAAGVNTGLHAARFPLLLILNNDTQAAPNLLERLEAARRRHPGTGFVAPVSNHVKGEARVMIGSVGRDPIERAAIAQQLAAAHRDQVQDVRTLAGLCLLLHRDTWQRIGDLDERFGHGNFEDDDWCLRARLHGYRLLIVRDAFLHHEGHATFKALGLDLPTELRRRRAQFEARWRDDPAGAALLAEWRGDTVAAGMLAQQAARAWPCWPDADWLQAIAASNRGDHERASDYFRAFLQQCPHHGEAALRLGELDLRRQEPLAAVRAVLATLQREFVDASVATTTLARCGEQLQLRGREDAAFECLELATAISPDDGQAHNRLGVALLQAGRTDEAITALTRATALDFPLADTNLGICWFQRQDRARALTHFEAAVARLPDDPTARQNLERCRAAVAATPRLTFQTGNASS